MVAKVHPGATHLELEKDGFQPFVLDLTLAPGQDKMVTETLAPAGATFQQWQTTQLQGIEQALAKATGK